MTSIQVLADNTAREPWCGEHGLALAIRYGELRILFDTGAGSAIMPNLAQAGLDAGDFTHLILSHGHYDHTGGLARILPVFRGEVYYGRGCTGSHWSLHPDKPPRNIAMPEECREALSTCPRKQEITGFTGIAPGVWLTGPIPRTSGEDCGGPFYQDEAGTVPDTIADEQALLLGDGTLIQGCCHAGIINTVTYCRQCVPDLPITHIVGGLHLLHAGPERLKETADFLRDCGLRQVTLLHCTGENAFTALPELLDCPVVIGETGWQSGRPTVSEAAVLPQRPCAQQS